MGRGNIPAAFAQKAVSLFYKYLNNPNTAIKRMFEGVEKSTAGQMPTLKTTPSKVPQYKSTLRKNTPKTDDLSSPKEQGEILKTTTKDLEPLAQSISKAKASGQSFDEWMKGQGETMYHGTSDNFTELKLQNGRELGPNAIFISPQKGVADYYAQGIGKGGKGQVIEAQLGKAKLFDYKNPTDVENLWKSLSKKSKDEIMGFETTDYVSMDKIKSDIQKGRYDILEKPVVQDAIKKLGYDGFHIRDYTGGDATGIFNPEVLKTRSQLKAEWDKVRK
jgi:hypothetical protein